MKRIIILLLATAMLLSLGACGPNTNEPQNTSQVETSKTTESTTANADTSAPDSTAITEPTTAVSDTTDPVQPAEKKVLVLYFSAQTAIEGDAISGATPRVSNMAATEYLANMIHDQVGGDLSKIMAVEKYPIGYNETADQAKTNADGDKRPAITVDVNPADYDVIFIGYPIWWYTLPMEMYTFFDNYDLSGKTVIPFNTHAGSRDGGTYRTIKDMEPGAMVLDGFNVNGGSVGNSADQVKNWIDGLHY
ncbi:MAG: flavodoxin [Clostridia bacterium]|nr:flavodoxin [Clostridia bacterium]